MEEEYVEFDLMEKVVHEQINNEFELKEFLNEFNPKTFSKSNCVYYILKKNDKLITHILEYFESKNLLDDTMCYCLDYYQDYYEIKNIENFRETLFQYHTKIHLSSHYAKLYAEYIVF